MKCYDDEIFGPVLMVTRVKTYAEGLALIQRGWVLHGSWSAQGRPVGKRSTL